MVSHLGKVRHLILSLWTNDDYLFTFTSENVHISPLSTCAPFAPLSAHYAVCLAFSSFSTFFYITVNRTTCLLFSLFIHISCTWLQKIGCSSILCHLLFIRLSRIISLICHTSFQKKWATCQLVTVFPCFFFCSVFSYWFFFCFCRFQRGVNQNKNFKNDFFVVSI